MQEWEAEQRHWRSHHSGVSSSSSNSRARSDCCVAEWVRSPLKTVDTKAVQLCAFARSFARSQPSACRAPWLPPAPCAVLHILNDSNGNDRMTTAAQIAKLGPSLSSADRPGRGRQDAGDLTTLAPLLTFRRLRLESESGRRSDLLWREETDGRTGSDGDERLNAAPSGGTSSSFAFTRTLRCAEVLTRALESTARTWSTCTRQRRRRPFCGPDRCRSAFNTGVPTTRDRQLNCGLSWIELAIFRTSPGTSQWQSSTIEVCSALDYSRRRAYRNRRWQRFPEYAIGYSVNIQYILRK